MSRIINGRWLVVITGGLALLAGLVLASTTTAGAATRGEPIFECTFRVQGGNVSANVAIANDRPFGDATINFRDDRWIATLNPNEFAQAEGTNLSRVPDTAVIRINGGQDRLDIPCTRQ